MADLYSDIAALRPLIACYADTIVECGPLGSGHTMKLINNFVSIGSCAVLSEALATAAKLGVDLGVLDRVLAAGGANSRMRELVMPWVLDGDDSHLKGPLRIAAKDMRFYCKLAEQAPAAALVVTADALAAVIEQARQAPPQDRRWAKALERAADRLRRVRWSWEPASERLLIHSARPETGKKYVVSAGCCDATCEASAKGQPCWHRAARQLVVRAAHRPAVHAVV